MLRHWILGGLGGLAVASVACADPGTVKTRDGSVYRGEVTESNNTVEVDHKGIHTVLDRSAVLSVSYADSVESAARARLARLNPTDVAGRLELARWLFENGGTGMAAEVLIDAQRLQPRNPDVADLLRTIDRQQELEVTQARHHRPEEFAAADGQVRPAPPRAPATQPAGGRLPTPEEINEIRQAEWQKGQQVSVKFMNDVRRKYIAKEGVTPAEFNRLPPDEQAWAIVQNGTPEMKKDVVLGDPPVMKTYRTVQRTLVAACANCHTTQKPTGKFLLHVPMETDAATYANFLILQRYEHKEGDRAYQMIDRQRPDSSLLVQFALPPDVGQPAHPKEHYAGIVKTRKDPRVQGALDWISGMNPVVPDYSDIDLSGATTKPARGSASQTR